MADKLTETVERLRDAARWLVDHASHHGSYAAIDQDQVDGLRDAVNAYDLAALTPAGEDAPRTPAARWRENGEPDPHGNSYDCERAKLCGGHLTDDEVAYQTAMLMRDDLNHEAVLQTAKDRIRWLSRALTAALSRPNVDEAPVPMILHCPSCGLQHIDEPESALVWTGGSAPEPSHEEVTWDNPPHRSHLCHGCGCIWRPADVATEGVRSISTTGKADTWKPGAERPNVGEMREALSDPNAVHVNLLRGTIARPSVEQIIHIYRPEVLLAALNGSGNHG